MKNHHDIPRYLVAVVENRHTDTKVCEKVINKAYLVLLVLSAQGNVQYVLEGRIKAFTSDGKDDHNNNVIPKFYYFRSDLALIPKMKLQKRLSSRSQVNWTPEK